MKLPRIAESAEFSGERAISWSAAGIPCAAPRPASRRFVGRAFRALCVSGFRSPVDSTGVLTADPVKPGRPGKRDWRGAPNLCADSPAASIPEKNLRAQRQTRTLPARPLQHFSEEAR